MDVAATSGGTVRAIRRGVGSRAVSSGPSGSLSVELPPEPPDRAVVLDREADAWQRRDSSWQRVGAVVKLFGNEGVRSWSHLVVDHGPLTRLVTEDEAAPVLEGVEPGWRRAGFDGAGCEVLDFDPGPHGSTGSERFGPADGWADAGFDAPDCELFAGNDDPALCAMTAP